MNLKVATPWRVLPHAVETIFECLLIINYLEVKLRHRVTGHVFRKNVVWRFES